ASLLLPIADTVPKLNVEPTCRAAAKAGEGLDAKFSQCMAQEESARVKLQGEWLTFSASSRSSCASVASGSDIQSYVELLSCLELERDAAKLEKDETRKSGR